MVDSPFRGAVVIAAVIMLSLSSCVPEPAADIFAAGDMRPPAVASWGPTGGSTLVIAFDEAVAEIMPGLAASPGDGVASARIGDDGASVIVELAGSQSPGQSYAVSGIVLDAAGNASSFVLPYWGYNPDPPLLLFNELLTQGSSTHPDAIELYVSEGGDCAGLALFIGAPAAYDARYVFPPLSVAAGDYIVVHMKPEGIEAEVDEAADKAASGGLDASPAAWDLWYRGGDGALSGMNGALSLCSSPAAPLLDAVVYSERRVDSDAKYGGFGTAALRDRVAAIVALGGWSASDPPRPEDCARSVGVTSTRTLCRSSSSSDTGSGADWHVVPTKGSSLGSVNVAEVYAP